MDKLAFRNRPHHCFVSYGSEDAESAREIVRWLEAAGLQVWFDKARLGAGAAVVEQLTREVGNARGFVLLATETALGKNYVGHEIHIATDEQINHPEFTVIVLRHAKTLDVSTKFAALKKLSWLDLENGRLGVESARRLLLSLTPRVEILPQGRHAFVTCSWGELDTPLTRKVCAPLAQRGVRLVGDSPEQKRFGEDWRARVARIMAGCGGHLMVLPERKSPGRSPEEIYKNFLAEAEIGRKLSLPRRIFCANRSILPAALQVDAIEVPANVSLGDLERELISLHDEIEPTTPYVFLATDFKVFPERNAAARDVVRHVLGMECWMGDDHHGENLDAAIIDRIRHANLAFADLACEPEPLAKRLRANLNTCIEAGVAIGAGRPVFATALDPHSFDPSANNRTAQVPFMFRNHQIHWYSNAVDYLAVIHRIAMANRRRILNDELT